MGTSLVVQWLRLCALTARNSGSIPGWGTKVPTFPAVQPKQNKQTTKKTKQNYMKKMQLLLFLFNHSILSDSLQPPWTAARQVSLSFTISQSLFKLMCIGSVLPSNHLILCHPLFLLPSIFPSIRVFSNKSALHIRWPRYWSFSFSTRPSSVHSGLISFRIDWLDLFAVQGTLKSLIQYHHSCYREILRLKLYPLEVL